MQVRTEHLAEGVTPKFVTIYALCQPVDKWKTGDVRYVGKTIGVVWHRVRAHSYAASRVSPRLPVQRWLKKQMAAGNPFHIRHLERVPVGDDWAARERHWIAKFRSEGADLLNLTDGGEGLHGRVMPAEHRAKISAALKTGSHRECLTCGAVFWRKLKDIAAGDDKFCSRPCYAKSRRGVSRPVPIECTKAGIAAAAASKRAQTKCKRGHFLSGTNLFLTSAGSRGCKQCRRLHKLTYRAKGGK